MILRGDELMDGRCESEQGVRAWGAGGTTTERRGGRLVDSCGHDGDRFGSI